MEDLVASGEDFELGAVFERLRAFNGSDDDLDSLVRQSSITLQTHLPESEVDSALETLYGLALKKADSPYYESIFESALNSVIDDRIRRFRDLVSKHDLNPDLSGLDKLADWYLPKD